jgi:hypothetical protein
MGRYPGMCGRASVQPTRVLWVTISAIAAGVV